ncbi:hypothetical protein [uncultured Parvibaculum sp.]|uniref:PIN-like domain-containing protein n=1 Tax=uncultured Parvibaculum sp. TaxID=291828 RepID=UPI0030D90EDD
MKIFFDNCTSPTLASTLNGFVEHLGHEAVHIKDLPCGRHATDLEWIEYLSKDNIIWIVVTGDGRIRKNKAERTAFRTSGLMGFVLHPSYQKTPMHQCASFLIWRWPDIEDLSRLVGGSALYELPMSRTARIRQLPF